MSKDFFDRKLSFLKDCDRPCPHHVMVGNGLVEETDISVQLSLAFADDKGDHEATCTVYVIRGLPTTLIVGWEDLTSALVEYFSNLVEKAVMTNKRRRE
jgi:hypothetical protein